MTPRATAAGGVEVTQADELRALIAKATDSDLSDNGRYFAETCDDLTRCRHEEVGEYQHPADGKLVEWLWNHRHSILSALTPPLAMPGREEVARAIYQTEYPTAHGHPTWDDWVAYAEAHRGHQPSVDLVRKQADRILSLFATPEGGEDRERGVAVEDQNDVYGTLPPGMKPWHGGDSAPVDWDGGPVLLRDGEIAQPPKYADWYNYGGPHNIIAYTPAASAPSQDDVSALREALEEIWGTDWLVTPEAVQAIRDIARAALKHKGAGK